MNDSDDANGSRPKARVRQAVCRVDRRVTFGVSTTPEQDLSNRAECVHNGRQNTGALGAAPMSVIVAAVLALSRPGSRSASIVVGRDATAVRKLDEAGSNQPTDSDPSTGRSTGVPVTPARSINPPAVGDHVRMKAIADLTLWESDRRFRLPGSGTPSMLFRFGGGTGAVTQGAITVLGVFAIAGDGATFAPGTAHKDVRLEFWAAGAAETVVLPGSEFAVWYGGDIGEGQITSLA
jgi:hypothetical protein